MMDAIGGYFELELRNGKQYHSNAMRLNSARSCLEYVLRVRQYKKVYIPYYTCHIICQPFDLLNISYDFYHINEKLEPVFLPKLEKDEAFLYTNYFGLKQECVNRLACYYGTKLIVDNAQAFFAEPIDGIDTFYSSRKFFGVPDGGFLYINALLERDIPQAVSYDRMSHLLKRIDLGAEAGYDDYKKNDTRLAQMSIMRLSNLTEKLLCSIDYDFCRKKRIENYRYLDKRLKATNKVHFELFDDDVPMVYPYWTDDAGLRDRLIENKIFVAMYWPNVLEWCGENDIEYKLTKYMLPLPCDQRYGEEEMNGIIELIYASQK